MTSRGAFPIACTQEHHVLPDDRSDAIVHAFDIAQFAHATTNHKTVHLSLYPEYPYEGHKWGMSIDMNACIGCNACITA